MTTALAVQPVQPVDLSKYNKAQLRAWAKQQDSERLRDLLDTLVNGVGTMAGHAKDVFVAGMGHEEVRYFVIILTLILLTRARLISPELGGLLIGSYTGMAAIDVILPW